MPPINPARHDELNRLFVDALAERLRRQDRLEPHAQRIFERATGDPRWLGRGRILRGYAAAYQGRFDEAHSLASEALAELVSTTDPAGQAAARDLFATCALIRNDYDATLAALMPNATYAEVPGGHMSAVTKPELGNAIADYLAA